MPSLLAVATTVFRPSGRVARRGFWFGTILVTVLLALVEPPLASVAGPWATILVFLPCYWVFLCLMIRRCHDTGRSAIWLLTLLIPLLGFVWMVAVLFFRRGDPGSNPYGPDPHESAPDYLVVEAVS